VPADDAERSGREAQPPVGRRATRGGATVALIAACVLVPWGRRGHEMAAHAAVATLPEEMPDFFRAAGPRLEYLNPEPDRWRSAARSAMDEAWSYDHYIDFERVPEDALRANDRWTYLSELHRAGLTRPERDAGLLPWRILELYERLVSGWRRWHQAPAGSEERRWIESRILDDAGILGHYVTDGAQPHHTTIHFNGWDRDTPNPEGFTTNRDFHARFESDFISAHVRPQDLTLRVPARPRSIAGSARVEIFAFLRDSFAAVPDLYEIERDTGFRPGIPPDRRARDFAADRLAAGSAMLAAVWWSAWLEGSVRADDP
jgi:hypothetical protein